MGMYGYIWVYMGMYGYICVYIWVCMVSSKSGLDIRQYVTIGSNIY